jgi:hypothetical protein
VRLQELLHAFAAFRKLVCAQRNSPAAEDDDLRDQLLLRLEMREDRPVGDARSLRHILHARVHDTAHGKHAISRLDDFLFWLFLLESALVFFHFVDSLVIDYKVILYQKQNPVKPFL